MNLLDRDKIVIAKIALALCLGASLSGCHRSPSPEDKARRAELRRLLRAHDFEKATPLARDLVKKFPRDNGAWHRFFRAQIGAHDFDGAAQTLTRWRAAARSPGAQLEESAGDLDLAQNELARAVQSWRKATQLRPKSTRLFEKIARAENAQRHWKEEDAAWTARLQIKEDAVARCNRALCRRHLHHWDEALEDLHRAQMLAPNNPDVQRVDKLFNALGKVLDEVRDIDARLAVAPNDSGLLCDRALIFLRGEDGELAWIDSARAAQIAPWAMRPKLFQGLALIQLGRIADCQNLGVRTSLQLAALTPEFLQTLSRLDADISLDRKNAELYAARAWQLNEIQQPALALRDAEEALRLNAKSAAAHLEKSYALRKLGRAGEAFDEVKQATDLDRQSRAAWQYRGELEMEQANYNAAIDSFSFALALSQSAAVLQKREECYRHVGLIAKADADHRAAQELIAKGLQ